MCGSFGEKVIILLEDDAPRSLLLGDADLLDGVGRERVGSWQQRGLGPETSLVSDVANLSEGAVREREPVGRVKS